MEQTLNVGVIGLGQIGSGIALCLARAGMLRAVYDVRAGAAKDLEGVPLISATSVEVARTCDVLIIAVVSAEQTIDVLNGPGGVLAAARPELTIILVATVSLGDLGRIRAITDAAGVALIDSGVAGGLKARENGLVCLVGAEDSVLAKVMPVFEGFARSVLHMGGPGDGMAAKIARNAVFLGCLRAGYEGAEIARAAGVDVHLLARAVNDSADGVGGPMLMMDRPDDSAADATSMQAREAAMAVMGKDLDAALDFAQSADIELPLVALTRKTLRVVVGLPR